MPRSYKIGAFKFTIMTTRFNVNNHVFEFNLMGIWSNGIYIIFESKVHMGYYELFLQEKFVDVPQAKRRGELEDILRFLREN